MKIGSEQLRAWLALARTPGLGRAELENLLNRFGTVEAVFQAAGGEYASLSLKSKTRAALSQPDWPRVDADLDWLSGADRHCIPCTHEAFPPLLRELEDCPLLLFVAGDPSQLISPQLAMVGSRNPTPSGRETASAFASYLAGCGLTITSGLALGIDAASHQGALDAGGKTIAVCGTGLDRVYPARHRELAHRIVEQGALVSEFSPGMPPLKENFPRRNRIISGLAVGTLVVEAAKQSGSLITARLATEQGREVFAIPGSIHNPLAHGCHQLIRQGAKLVESGGDILEELAPLLSATLPSGTVARDTDSSEQPDPEYDALLKALDHAPTSVDVLVTRTGLTPDAVSSMLLMLELQGHVESAPGGHYTRVTKRPD